MSSHPKKDLQRELEICALYSGGDTMQQIADRYGVSRERIRQILARNGLGGKLHYTRIDVFRVLALVPDCESVRDLAAKSGYPLISVTRLLRRLAPDVVVEYAAYRHEAARNRAIASLRALAKKLGYTPGKDDIDFYGSPSCSLIQYLFGSLAAGQRAAGLVPTKVGGRSAKVAA